MIIKDYEDSYSATNENDIEEIMAHRYKGNVNAFWLSHGANNFPVMLVLVKENVASLHFFTKDRDPGLSSIGHVNGYESGGISIFYMNNAEEEHEVSNDSIILVNLAICAAKEFQITKSLPKCVEWLEL